MPLNSFTFLFVFLPVTAIVVHLLRDSVGGKAARVALLLLSVAFYATDRLQYVPLLLASIAVNWYVARQMGAAVAHSHRPTRLLQLGIGANILLLCAFKYVGVVTAAVAGASESYSAVNWVFPLGISFFTLTQVMYLVDVYEGLITPNSIFDHGVFVSFFPTITAGPLLRSKRFIGQLDRIGDKAGRDEGIVRGLVLISIGLFKKVVIAESVAYFADAGFNNTASLSTSEAWLAAWAYTFQMYFDFSGYTDMAFGAALVLGVEIVPNFNAPYRASNVSAFWQRWHISLSSFITTYLYTPILRRLGKISVHTSAVATFIAMTIAGIWHGATLPFLGFYVMHGAGLAFYQYWKRLKRPLPRGIDVVVTFIFVTFAFVVFRSPDLTTAATMIGTMLSPQGLGQMRTFASAISDADLQAILLPCVLAPLLAFLGPTSNEIADRVNLAPRTLLAAGSVAAVALLFMLSSAGGGFIYRAF